MASQQLFVEVPVGRARVVDVSGNRKVIRSLSAAASLKPEDTSKEIHLASATAFTVTLPALADVPNGWNVRVRVSTKPGSGTHTVQEATASDTNVLVGSISVSENSDASVAAGNVTGFTNVNFTTTAIASDFIDIKKYGSNFYVSGHASLQAAVTFT